MKNYFFLQNAMGPCHSPFDSWLVLRGVKTLAIRMEKSTHNAKKIAAYLQQHSQVEKVIYLGLENHPQHKLIQQQITEGKLKNYGAMISFYLKGGLKTTSQFLASLKIFCLAESLGGIESLMNHPAIMTHASIPKEIRAANGISDNLIRISVGIEEEKDLITDLQEAFKACNQN